MHIQITSQAQLDQLRKGDLITQYAAHGEKPPDTFDKKNSTTYKIHSIKSSNHILELVMIDDPLIILLSPGSLGRMFIAPANLLPDGNWWLQ